MTPIFNVEGIYTPVVTPMTGNHGVHWDALADVVENLIDKGVHGLISGGSTGENYAQRRGRAARGGSVHPRDQSKGRFTVGGRHRCHDDA